MARKKNESEKEEVIQFFFNWDEYFKYFLSVYSKETKSETKPIKSKRETVKVGTNGGTLGCIRAVIKEIGDGVFRNGCTKIREGIEQKSEIRSSKAFNDSFTFYNFRSRDKNNYPYCYKIHRPATLLVFEKIIEFMEKDLNRYRHILIKESKKKRTNSKLDTYAKFLIPQPMGALRSHVLYLQDQHPDREKEIKKFDKLWKDLDKIDKNIPNLTEILETPH